MKRYRDQSSGHDNVSLTGDAATAWMAQRGIRVWGSAAGVRLFADTFTAEGLRVGRLHHNAQRISREATGEGLAISIIVEGSISVSSGTVDYALASGDAYVHPSPRRLEVRSSGLCGAVEIDVEPKLVSCLGIEPPPDLVFLSRELGILRILVALVVSTLNNVSSLTAPARSFVGHALASSTAAVLTEMESLYPQRPTTRSARVLRRARTVIAENYTDPEFSVSTLATLLGLSHSGLHAAFADAGTTPLTEIRKVRAGAAVRLLLSMNKPTAQDEAEVARSVGFRSVRAFQHARTAFHLRPG